MTVRLLMNVLMG